MRIAVLHGPNLNLLGTREPALYGTSTLADIDARLAVVARELGIELSCAQFNHEGDLLEAIHASRGRADGIVINAAAWTHTSLAVRDALTAVAIPFVEVHLTNIYARGPERAHSMLASAARGVLGGFGAYGYEMGLRGIVSLLRSPNPPSAPSAPAAPRG